MNYVYNMHLHIRLSTKELISFSLAGLQYVLAVNQVLTLQSLLVLSLLQPDAVILHRRS
jgi:hypothetical protein